MIPRSTLPPEHNDWQVLSFDSSPITALRDSSRTDDFVLSQVNNRPVIKSADGRQYDIVSAGVSGWVDGFRDDGDSVMAYGWAGDTTAGRVARQVVAFSRGKLVGQGATGVSRLDVADLFDAAGLRESGYALELPPDAPLACLRFFALSEAGTAAELAVAPHGLLNTNANDAHPGQKAQRFP